MTVRHFVAAAAVAAALAASVAGCGYKGPLTLPEEAGPVVIRPAVPSKPKPEDDEQAGPATAPKQGTVPDTSSAPATPPAAASEGPPAGG